MACSVHQAAWLHPTCSRNERDLLMYVASLATVPSVPVLAERSEPARSTMFSFEWQVFPSACQAHPDTVEAAFLPATLPSLSLAGDLIKMCSTLSRTGSKSCVRKIGAQASKGRQRQGMCGQSSHPN